MFLSDGSESPTSEDGKAFIFAVQAVVGSSICGQFIRYLKTNDFKL